MSTTSVITVNPGQVLSLSKLPPRTELVFHGDTAGNLSFKFIQGNASVLGDKKQVIAYAPSPGTVSHPISITGVFATGLPILIGAGLARGQQYQDGLYEQFISHHYAIPINGQSYELLPTLRLAAGNTSTVDGSTRHGSVITSDLQLQAVTPFTISVSSLWNPQLSTVPVAYNTWMPIYVGLGFLALAIIGFAFRSSGVLMRFVEAIGIMGVIGSAAWRAYQYFVYKE